MNEIMKKFLEQLGRDISDEEVAVAEHLRDFCIQNELEFPEQIFALQYLAGIDPKIVLTKINAVNTPLIENAMHVIH